MTVSSKTLELKSKALEALASIGVNVKEGKSIGIYGASMVGKSVLASIVAKEFVGEGGTVVIFGTETHYSDEDYRNMISQFLPKSKYINYCRYVDELYHYFDIVRKKNFEGRVAMILDSLSFIALQETAEWNMRGVTEPRVIIARVIPTLNTVATAFKELLVEKRALGIVIMHAGSTAGTGKFRGLVDFRPSMAMRVAHSLDYLLFMESEGYSLNSPRKLTLVQSRLSPLDEGKTVEIKFTSQGIEPIKTV
jgi:ABC-type hemin transport system ATPase subunit